MELNFSEGKFVASKGEINYNEVLLDFPKAKIVRILTYNISKNQKNDNLLDALKNTDADIQLITNVPSRQEVYFKSDAGERMRSAARNNIKVYISKLNPERFSENFTPFFNIHNHSKIIGTDNIVYIGSANFSNESADSIETGIIIKDKIFIERLYSEFFEGIKEESLPYYDETFTAFQLLILSLHAKFKHHYHKMMTELYTDYERTKLTVSDVVFLDINDLYLLYHDLDELKTIYSSAEETYDEISDEYNTDLEQLIQRFEQLSVDWVKKVISKEGSLYRLVSFDSNDVANDLLQNKYYFEAYDERLDTYAQKAVNDAAEMYSSLRDDFQMESDEFLTELEKILSTLEAAITFTNEWKKEKINLEIDNT